MVTKSPFFVLIGDPLLCEEKRKEILSLLEKDCGGPLALTLYRAGEADVTLLLQEARTLPFLVSGQVFCLANASQLAKNDLALLKEYLSFPAPRTFFFFEAESLERGHPLIEWASRPKQVFFLEPQSGKIIARFIREKLRRAGKKMAPGVQALLEERVGEAFFFLDSILDQLILYAGDRTEIVPSDVEALEERLVQLEGDDLLDALAERNIPKALQALNDLLESNFRDFPSVAGLLHWQLRRFWDAKRWQAEGMKEGEIALRLRLSPARAPYFFRELGRFSLKELEEILEGLFDLDWRLKTGRADGRYDIESWLIRAMG